MPFPRKPTPKQRRLADTAMHEAGHAVISVRLEIAFRYVMINVDADARGGGKIVGYGSPNLPHRLDHYLVSLLAGPEAARFTNTGHRRDMRGASSDYMQVARLLDTRLYCEPVIRAHLRYLTEWAKALVLEEVETIHAVAEHLYDNPGVRVSSAEVKKIYARPANKRHRRKAYLATCHWKRYAEVQKATR